MLSRTPTGVPGLDEVLHGGLIPGRMYLLSGEPGTGKTTVGMCFLREGVRRGERVLCITLSEPVANLVQNATAFGIEVAGIDFLDLSPTQEFFTQVETYDLFSSADVERVPTTEKILKSVEQVRPARVFVDSLSQFRYLAQNPFQYRKQVLSFICFLTRQGATVLATSERSIEAPDADLRFLADGVIVLSRTRHGRSLEILKFRGSSFETGVHELEFVPGGVRVLPRLVPPEKCAECSFAPVSSGILELDALCGGGLEEGTVTLITGPTGTGKTTLALQFAWGATRTGRRAAVYSFEEDVGSILLRAGRVGIPVEDMVRRGLLVIRRVEPLQYTPRSFAEMVIQEVRERDTLCVVVDSVSGYRLLVAGGNLEEGLYALGKYLAGLGRMVIFVNEVESITGGFQVTGRDLSHLADNIIFLQYLEVNGELRKTIGVLKKRVGDFEKTLREFEVTGEGIRIGKPLVGFRGVLEGIPSWVHEKTE